MPKYNLKPIYDKSALSKFRQLINREITEKEIEPVLDKIFKVKKKEEPKSEKPTPGKKDSKKEPAKPKAKK